MKKDNGLFIGLGALVLVVGLIAAALLTTSSNDAATTSSSSSAESTTSTRQTESKAKLDKEPLPQLSTAVADDESEVILHTTAGDVTIKLFNTYAPLAVKNFIVHAKAGYYDNTTFHRVVKDFMIQGGDPQSAKNPDADTVGSGGKSIYAPGQSNANKSIDSGTGFKNEISYSLYNIRGSLAMANAGTDTNGSQFFINQNSDDVQSQISKKVYPSKIYTIYKQGGNPSLDGSYTVFGQVIKGMTVVDKIASAKVKTNASGEKSKPTSPVKVTSITVVKEAE